MTYLLLFLEFFKVGLFTFGGGYAMIPLIEELVVSHSWATETQFYDFLGICESTPGPIAVNMATYIGSMQGGLLGSIAATLGVVLPSFIIILLIAAVLKNFTDNKYFKAFIKGVQPIIISLILSTGVVLLAKSVGYVSIKEFNFDIVSTIVFGILTILWFGYKKVFKKKLSVIQFILAAALLGILVSVLING